MTSSVLVLLGSVAFLAGPPKPVQIPFQSFKLDNGLNVILSEDHTAPVVGVDVLYDVGSKDEKPGRTGFAHLFEHLMFQGSEHFPKGEADRIIEAAGGSSNGGTRQDTTEYWEQVPANALEQMLAVESDRMGFLLPTLTQEKLDNQREVVLNERRQTYEMRPYGLAYQAIVENLWDPTFPYHWLTIGSPEDIKAATLEDVKQFFRRFYGPNDATLAIVGDIDPKRTRALVEKWFGSIPAGPRPPHEYPKPKPLESEKRVRMEDRVQLPRVYMAWQTPKVYAPGDAALDLLGEILSDGKSARLVKRLVMDERIAQQVTAGQQSQMLASTFMIVATPKPGIALDRLEKEIDEEVAKLASEPPTQGELERARNKTESQMIFGLEPVGGFGGRAAVLNGYSLTTGDPGYFPKDLERYRSVTAADVRDAAARWLRKNARVVLEVVPSGQPAPGAPSAEASGAMPQAEKSGKGKH